MIQPGDAHWKQLAGHMGWVLADSAKISKELPCVEARRLRAAELIPGKLCKTAPGLFGRGSASTIRDTEPTSSVGDRRTGSAHYPDWLGVIFPEPSGNNTQRRWGSWWSVLALVGSCVCPRTTRSAEDVAAFLGHLEKDS